MSQLHLSIGHFQYVSVALMEKYGSPPGGKNNTFNFPEMITRICNLADKLPTLAFKGAAVSLELYFQYLSCSLFSTHAVLT